MVYIDTWVKETHQETDMQGNEVPNDVLANLSQIHRSATGAEIFFEETGIRITSKDDLRDLFERVANNDIDLARVLTKQSLKVYAERTGPLNFD